MFLLLHLRRYANFKFIQQGRKEVGCKRMKGVFFQTLLGRTELEVWFEITLALLFKL